jgi:1,4-dihydroxy-2-naphthoyl-CoA synthase
MDTQEKARELLAKDRQYDHDRHEKMVNRAVETEEAYQETLETKARELLTQDRQEKHHLDENMLSRSTEEIHSV